MTKELIMAKKNFFAIYIFVAGISGSGNVISDDYPVCENVGSTIIYGNGVFTDEPTALLSMFKLRDTLKTHATIEEYSQLSFDLAYNRHEGYVSDLLEAMKQKLRSDADEGSFTSIFTGALSTSVKILDFVTLDLIPDDFVNSLAEISGEFDPSVITDFDTLQHLSIYQSAIAKGQKVIVVPHSQGNFFVNRAYEALTEEEKKSFGIVSVANPDTKVNGEGVYSTAHIEPIAEGDDRAYTTSDEDRIVNLLVQGALPHNVDNEYNFSDDPTGHYFTTSYLAPNSASRTSIIKKIRAANDQLIQPLSAPQARISSYEDDIQRNPVVVSLFDGSYVVAWTSSGESYTDIETGAYIEGPGQDGSKSGIFAQRYSFDGKKLGDEFQVNTFSDGHQTNQNITALKDGGFIIAWESQAIDRDNHTNIHAQRYRIDGIKYGGEIHIESNLYNYAPIVTLLKDGGFVILWSSSTGVDYTHNFFAQRFDINNNPVGNEFKYTSDYSITEAPHSSLLEDGRFIVVWSGKNKDSSKYGRVIHGQIFNADGSVSGDEFTINNLNTMHHSLPDVVSLQDGGFLISFHGYQDNTPDIFFQRYNQYAETLHSLIKLDTNINSTVDIQRFKSMSLINNNQFVVVWKAADIDAPNPSWGSIYARKYLLNGSPSVKTCKVNTDTRFSDFYPDVTSIPRGGVVATWGTGSNGVDGGGKVYALQF